MASLRPSKLQFVHRKSSLGAAPLLPLKTLKSESGFLNVLCTSNEPKTSERLRFLWHQDLHFPELPLLQGALEVHLGL